MRTKFNAISKCFLVTCLSLIAAAPAPKSPSEIANEAPKEAWQAIKDDNIVIAKLNDGSEFIFEIASDIAPIHSDNIKKLIRAGWFEKASIVRVQDNYVVQWGAPEGTKLPEGINPKPPAEYDFAKPKNFKPLMFKDAYAQQAGYINGWPAASNGTKAWLVHCYGMIGVGRDMAPDTGTGGELYTVIGHAPRHLDRNITLAGRIISGMENLTSRPRGTETMGFYKEDYKKTGFTSVKIASDLNENERPKFEALKTNSKTFETWLYAKANRGAPFFIRQSGAVDICNAQVPIRAVK